MATIIADYDLDAENASETIDAAEVDEVFGGHLPPDVKRTIHSLGGRNLRILPQCEDGTYLCTYTPPRGAPRECVLRVAVGGRPVRGAPFNVRVRMRTA